MPAYFGGKIFDADRIFNNTIFIFFKLFGRSKTAKLAFTVAAFLR